MSSDVLEKRYRTLLRAYPAEYRRERADELIDTLLGDEPTTRRWPTLRQATALIRGGLRVHSGSRAARPTAVLLWQGLHLGAMAVLALGALFGLRDVLETLRSGGLSDPLVVLRDHGVYVVMVGAALVALAAGRTRTAAVLTVAAAVVPTVISPHLFGDGHAAPASAGAEAAVVAVDAAAGGDGAVHVGAGEAAVDADAVNRSAEPSTEEAAEWVVARFVGGHAGGPRGRRRTPPA